MTPSINATMTQRMNSTNKHTKSHPPRGYIGYVAYQMELAEEAILGQRSAASFATGPVIPDPFISPLGLTITPALSRE